MNDQELKRHFEVLTEHLDSKIPLLAEGQTAPAERLSGRIERLDPTMREENEETRSLIRLSDGQIDRRVASLETDVADLRARLERLESHRA